MPATSSQALSHCLRMKENQLWILGVVDMRTLSNRLAVSCCITKATTSSITTLPTEEREMKLNTEFGQVGEVDEPTHSSTLVASHADTETTITMLPGDKMETTRTLDVKMEMTRTLDIMFANVVDKQTHSNTTSTLPPTTSVAAEIITSTTLPKDKGRSILDVIRCGQTT